MSVLGKSDGRDVKLNDRKRTRGLYCIGTTGTGKTTFLVNLALQDIQNGHGICYLDPHGDAIRDILKRIPDDRIPDVIYLNVEDNAFPFGLNLFDCPDPKNDRQVALTASFITHVFEKVWGAGTDTPVLSQFIRNIAVTLIENTGLGFTEVPLLLLDETIRQKLTSNLRNPQVKQFWDMFSSLKKSEQLDRIASTYNKIDAFLTHSIIRNIIGQSKTTINLREFMDEQQILLVQLSPRFEDITSLVGAMLIGKILDAAYSRADTRERPYFALYADEFQRFATSDFETMLTEARKFGIGITIAHQVRSQLETSLKGATLNAGNLVVFRVSGQDAEELAVNFDSTPPVSRETRREAVLTPVMNVIEKLLHGGSHPNKKVRTFVNLYLKPIQSSLSLEFTSWDNVKGKIVLRTYSGKENGKSFRDEYKVDQDDLRFLVEKLNNFLFSVMSNPPEIPYDEHYNLFLEYFSQQEWMEREIGHIYKEELRYWSGKLSGALGFSKYVQLFEDEWEKGGYSVKDAIWREVLEDLGISNLEYFNDNDKRKRVDEEMKQAPDLDLYYQLEQLLKDDPLCKRENTRWMLFKDWLKYLLAGLALEPILEASGRYEEKPVAPRTYADRQAEIANQLATLPPYTAKVKLDQEELLLTTFPFSQGMRDYELDTIITYIQDMNEEDGYCRDKSSVEAEITKRQKALREKQRIIDIDL